MQLIQVSLGALNNNCVEGINEIQYLKENFPVSLFPVKGEKSGQTL